MKEIGFIIVGVDANITVINISSFRTYRLKVIVSKLKRKKLDILYTMCPSCIDPKDIVKELCIYHNPSIITQSESHVTINVPIYEAVSSIHRFIRIMK